MSLVVVTGTGTEIGKTTLAVALATAIGRAGRSVAAVKPIESGDGADGRALGQASTFHVTRFQVPYLFPHPVSPHLAARRAGATIELPRVTAPVDALRREAEVVLVELAGGLFSPLGPGIANADLVRALAPDLTILVAPDRLGVLHDVAAASRAAASAGVSLNGIVLSTPDPPDASTGTNAAEMGSVTNLPVLAVLPRASLDALVPLVAGLVAGLVAR